MTPDTLREALERIRDEHGGVCDEFETCSHRSCRDSFAAREIADAALAASPPPAREWRVVARGRISLGEVETPVRGDSTDNTLESEGRARARAEGLAADFGPTIRYAVQAREVGPWVDVPAEGEGP